MIDPTGFPPARHSLDLARKRDDRIRSLLDSHPVTAAMLVRLGWFPSKDTALRRLNRLACRRKIHVLGTVQRTMGRPEKVYGRVWPKRNQLLHEVELTDVCLCLNPGTVLRGPSAADDSFHPDARLWFRDELFYLEVDRGTMGYAQIERRYRRYDGCPQVVLWVCPSEERLDELRKRAAGVHYTPLFTTVADVLANPRGEIWRDVAGSRVALPQNRS